MSDVLHDLIEEEQQQNIVAPSLPTPVEADTPVQQEDFPGPQGQGRSQVDLSIEENKQAKDSEYNVWWNMPYKIDGEVNLERDSLKEAWYQKYYGASSGDINYQYGGFYPGANNPLGNLQNTFQGLSVPGLAIADFFTDAVGMLPGAGSLDDKWDETTELDNPIHQGIRRVLSVVIPAMYTGNLTAGALTKLPQSMPFLQKALLATGAFAAQEAAIIGISDVGEDDNALRALSDFFPGVFGEEGFAPIPDWAKTLDDDSPKVRKYKNMYDTAGLSILGSVLGAYIRIKGAKGALSWMEPLDETAASYKATELANVTEADKLIRLQEINTLLSGQSISKAVRRSLNEELDLLKNSLGGVEDLEDYLKQADNAKVAEQSEAARRKLSKRDPTDTSFDPDIAPVGDEASNARQVPPTGNVARNMADTTANKLGVTSGDNAPIITESMRTKGLMVGNTSRDAIMGVAEEARDAGRFNALVDGFRFTSKQMDSAAWAIYESIIQADTIDETAGLFLENKDIKNLLMGKFKVEYINEEQARGAAFAMRDLVDRFLGRHIAMTSARVMDTLGREASTMGEAIQQLQPFVDDARAMDLVIDKLQFLMDEYALNKYISGWSLKMKDFFDSVAPDDIEEAIVELTKEFTSAENAIHAKNLRFTKTLKELADTNPMAMRPLMDAFAESRGDVDTLAKLYKYAAEKVTPLGLIKSPNPKQLNLFARGAWGVRYNNVLSGLSAFRAGIGNTGQLILRPITAVLGHGFLGPADAFEGFKRTMYYNGAMFETNRRALHDAFQMMKKAHKDPEMMIKAYRKDFVVKDTQEWEWLEGMLPVWEQEGNWGRIIQYNMAHALHGLSKHPALRYGMTGLTFPDAFTWTHMATWISRTRAYDDVFSEFGFADWNKIKIAEGKHYKTMFDPNGLPTDKLLRSLSGEISLNLDDGLSTWINQATTAYPISKELFMFPRTQSNVVKNALSWTPISLIPGINKYSKTIYAGNNPNLIADALKEHGIDMATTPNAKIVYENLRAEYIGRQIFSGLLTKSLWDYAMAGNIRGNGHYQASRRKAERKEFGYEPLTINIGGKWVSYKGLIGIQQVLSIIGDMSYYAGDIEQPMLEDWHSKLMWTLSAAFLNDTPLQGMEPLVAALNNDLSAWNRLVANSVRGWIPQSSALGVLSDAVTSAQKSLSGEIHEYVMNRIPVASSMLPRDIDIWTGKPLNDIDNPFLRVLNALSPIKISGTREPWRVWLESTGWSGLSMLKKHSSGSHEYTTAERETLYKYIGEEQMYKQLERLMKSKRYTKEIEMIRNHRNTENIDKERIKLKHDDLPVIQEINRIVKTAQKKAEVRLVNESKGIASSILMDRLARERMRTGDVEGAAEIQKQDEKQRTLLNMTK